MQFLISEPAKKTVTHNSFLVYQFKARLGEGTNMGANLFNFVYVDESSVSSNILNISSTAKWNAHFGALKETDKLMVIDFTATWCAPCKLMDPVIQEFAAKYPDVEFIKIDVDQLMELSQALQVQALPTFILIKKGIVIDRAVGVRKEELQRMIEKHRK